MESGNVRNCGVTSEVFNYINDMGINLTAMSEKTGISYNALWACKKGSRKLRADELLRISEFLKVDPRAFSSKGKEASA